MSIDLPRTASWATLSRPCGDCLRLSLSRLISEALINPRKAPATSSARVLSQVTVFLSLFWKNNRWAP